MDSLKKEIGRKRKQLEENSILVPGKKFFKRGCLTKKEETVEKTDESCLNEILVSNRELKKQNIAGAARNDLRVVADATTYEKIPEVVSTCHIARELSLTYPFLTHAKDLGKGNVDFDIQAISQLLKLLLEIWNQKLRSRSDETKESVQGKRDSADYAQTQRYLKPLFKKLRNKSIQDDILDSLTTIVGHLLDRNYVLANAAYLQLAIGNAPWPIGVTMVGIHVRKGREKISSKNIAHVLNDETQRKYIHGLKRLITKCQSFFPTDPSRCVV